MIRVANRAMAALPPYVRYIGVSAAALGIDMGVFLGLIAGGTAAILAAAVGYSVGIIVHWWLTSRIVFADRLAPTARGIKAQQALFVGSALVGLAITMTIVGAAHWAGLDPRLGKIVAIAVSFNATYVMRKLLVFG